MMDTKVNEEKRLQKKGMTDVWLPYIKRNDTQSSRKNICLYHTVSYCLSMNRPKMTSYCTYCNMGSGGLRIGLLVGKCSLVNWENDVNKNTKEREINMIYYTSIN